jgi:phosphonate transport system substrate-binding protein
MNPGHTTAICLAVTLWAAPVSCGRADGADPAAPAVEVHFAFSKVMFGDVNENDALAAIRVYTQSIADQNGIYVNNRPALLDGTNAILQEVEHKRSDIFVLTAEEFFTLENLGLEGPYLIAENHGSSSEEFLLLTRTDGAVRRVEDLQGCKLNVSSDFRSGLSRMWLAVLCREHGLGPPEQALGRITAAAKPAQVILPVFFGQADACIATRTGWAVMGELNPQLAQQLRVIAVSPPVVPTVTCFRAGFTAAFRQQCATAMLMSATKPAFKQILVMFKTDELACQPAAVLESTRALVADYHRLGAETNAPPVEAERRGP